MASPGTRFDATEAKATKRPFADTATVPTPLPPFASTAADETLTRIVVGAATAVCGRSAPVPTIAAPMRMNRAAMGTSHPMGAAILQVGQFVCNRTISVHPLINRLAVA